MFICLCYSKKFRRGKFYVTVPFPPRRKQCSEYPLNHEDKIEAEYLRAVRSHKISTYDTQGYSYQPLSAN